MKTKEEIALTKKKYKQSHRHQINLDAKRWRENNKEKFKDIQHRCYLKHKKENSEYSKQYRKIHRVQLKEYNRQYLETNKDLIHLKAKIYYNQNPDKMKEKTIKSSSVRKNNKLKRYYGISLKDYEQLLIKHNYKCAICGVDECNSPRKKLCIDHNHKTNTVRGILCTNCNAALGQAKESREILTNMIKYLEKYEEPSKTNDGSSISHLSSEIQDDDTHRNTSE